MQYDFFLLCSIHSRAVHFRVFHPSEHRRVIIRKFAVINTVYYTSEKSMLCGLRYYLEIHHHPQDGDIVLLAKAKPGIRSPTAYIGG